MSPRQLLDIASRGKTQIVLNVKVHGSIAKLALPTTYTLTPDLRVALGNLQQVA